MLAHFALSDLEGGHFFAAQRLERPVLGIAGATDDPLAVWVGDWGLRLERTPREQWHLEARENGRQLALSLNPAKPVVLHGKQGYSRKGESISNASCYYSQSRLLAEGQITLNDQRYTVKGNAWFDHEWGSGVLDANTDGWDWFGLQFDDGSELMLYRLRDQNGQDSPWGSGTLIHPDGQTTTLGSRDFRLSPTRHWTSPVSKRRYPTGWSVEVPGAGMKFAVNAALPDQEWTGIVGYWEGAVAVTGTRRGDPLSGKGYMELTAYA
jgi:predicted secreted hydrolase